MVQETSEPSFSSTPGQPSHGEKKNGQTAPPRSGIFRDLLNASGFVTHVLRHPLETARTMAPTLHQLSFGLVGEAFKPERDIGDLSGKVVLVTGGMYIYISILGLDTGDLCGGRLCRRL